MTTVDCPLGQKCDTVSKKHKAGSAVLKEHTKQAKALAHSGETETVAPAPSPRTPEAVNESNPGASARPFNQQAAWEVLDTVNSPYFNADLDDAFRKHGKWGGISGAARKRYKQALNNSQDVSDEEFRKIYLDLNDKAIEHALAYEEVKEAEVAQLDEIDDALGEFSAVEHYDGNRLGYTELIGEAKLGTKERSALLKEGINGWDAIRAMGITPWIDYKTGYATESEPHFVEMGQGRIAYHKNEDPMENASEFDARRHNTWKEVMLAAHLTELPEGSTIRSTDGVFKRKGSKFGLAAPDGVITGPNGNGLVYTYVSDSKYDWRRGVPLAEKARALYELEVTGADFADVLARVEGNYQGFRIWRGESLDGQPDGIRVEDKLPMIADTWEKAKQGPQPTRRKIGDTEYEREVAVDNMHGLFGGDRDEIKRELDRRIELDQDTDSAVREMIGQRWSRQSMGRIASIDGEVASAHIGFKTEAGEFPKDAFSPEFENWIETGIVSHDSNGNRVGEVNSLHGLDPRLEKVNGTGAEDVHHISVEMVRDKDTFPDDTAQTERELNAADVIMAHNAKFESPRLGGYIPSTRRQRPGGGKRWLDSAWITRHFMESAPQQREFLDGSLNALVVDTGGSYEGAHRAYNDAEMTMDAIEKVFAKDQWWNTVPS